MNTLLVNYTSLVLYGAFGAILVATGATIFHLWRKHRKAAKKLAVCQKNLESTSRILIQKNIELTEHTIRLQKMLETKDDFIAIVSHQLRTPITEIKWGASSILENKAWKLEGEQRHSVEVLLASAERMVKIVNTLLQMVVSGQKASFTSIDPYEADAVVREMAERAAKDFHDKPVELKLDLTYQASISSIDPDSFGMLVSNLVENAFHYTQKEGTIALRTASGEGGVFELFVEDTGMGISADKQKTMFVKFNRAKDAIKANIDGSGLGLYIVKNVVEQHGGKIDFTSQEGVGSTFHITLPQKQ